MSEKGRAAGGPQVEVAGKAAGGDYSPDAGETARAMTANAVVSAVANVPLLLAAVALVVYMAFEAGLSVPGTIFGLSPAGCVREFSKVAHSDFVASTISFHSSLNSA